MRWMLVLLMIRGAFAESYTAIAYDAKGSVVLVRSKGATDITTEGLLVLADHQVPRDIMAGRTRSRYSVINGSLFKKDQKAIDSEQIEEARAVLIDQMVEKQGRLWSVNQALLELPGDPKLLVLQKDLRTKLDALVAQYKK